MKRVLFFLLLPLLISCSSGENYRCSKRDLCPEGALIEAKEALRKKDMVSFFETITDGEVRSKLKNSISLCSSFKLKEVKKFGYEESTGCELILKKYGWSNPQYNAPSEITDLWEKAILTIDAPRKMLYELETNHREYGKGASFAWSYLEPVKLVETVEEGSTAYSIVDWGGENMKLLYYKTQDGWQFEPEPWEAY